MLLLAYFAGLAGRTSAALIFTIDKRPPWFGMGAEFFHETGITVNTGMSATDVGIDNIIRGQTSLGKDRADANLRNFQHVITCRKTMRKSR